MSTRLFDVYPDLFEESYNWLNCPSLPPPSIEDPYKEDYEELPADVFSPISYEELYINGDTEVDSDITLYPTQEEDEKELSLVDHSMHQSIHHHILEYQVWKETLRYNDTRIIWWVCSVNPNHVWRESVASRVKSRTVVGIISWCSVPVLQE